MSDPFEQNSLTQTMKIFDEERAKLDAEKEAFRLYRKAVEEAFETYAKARLSQHIPTI